MRFSKSFHRSTSFRVPSSLKSTPDGQKLFLNWPCNSSGYINPPTILSNPRPGDVLFCLEGLCSHSRRGEALRAGKWSQISLDVEWDGKQVIGYRPATSSHGCPLPPLPCSAWLSATGLGVSKTPGCRHFFKGPPHWANKFIVAAASDQRLDLATRSSSSFFLMA